MAFQRKLLHRPPVRSPFTLEGEEFGPMSMIDPNVMRAIGEVLASHNVQLRPGEQMSDALARALDLNDTEVHAWLTALSEGCSVEEANRRAGITSHKDEGLAVSLARTIGTAIGKIAR